MSIKTEIKEIQEMLKRKGFNVDSIGASGLLSDEEKLDLLYRTAADITRKQTSNSTKINKKNKVVQDDHFYLGFISDTHSDFVLLEEFLDDLEGINGKCIGIGD